MRKADWSRQAQTDVDEIDDYFLQYSREAADAVFDRLVSASRFLCEHPHAGAPLAGSVRKWSARGTPYLMLYRVQPTKVQIVRVYHAATDWKQRA